MKRVWVAVACAALLAGCSSTKTKDAVPAPKSGSSEARPLERCEQPLGTLTVYEDTNASWYIKFSHNSQLRSTEPTLRRLAQRSNCFVVVDRTVATQSMEHERKLANTATAREGSNFKNNQIVVADYTLTPEIVFSGKASGAEGTAAFLIDPLGLMGLAVREANTMLTLTDNRSGVLLATSEGYSKQWDSRPFGSSRGDAKSPIDEVVFDSFEDSFNRIVIAVRNYKTQNVKGGLGTGGNLKVQPD